MLCISGSRLLKLIANTMLVAGLTAAQAQTAAGQKRPATVPADYFNTPFGYFHPSCVTHLAKGDVVRKDESAIRHTNGTSDNIHVRLRTLQSPRRKGPTSTRTDISTARGCGSNQAKGI